MGVTSNWTQLSRCFTLISSSHLVVDEADVLLKAGVEELHVVLLRLDGVREEAEGLVALQAVDRDLLHAKHHRRLGYVLLHHCPNLGIIGNIHETHKARRKNSFKVV